MKISYNAPFTLLFALLAGVSFFLFLNNNLYSDLFVLQGKTNFDDWHWYAGTLFYTLGHADFNHLAGNFMFILLLGPIVENHYGSKKLLKMSIITALLTSLIHVVFWDHNIIGASGIVFMLIILAAFIPSKNKEIPLTFILIIILFLGKEILGSFSNDNISHFAHISGGIFGAMLGYKSK